MKIKRLETFLANAGLRSYLFVRLVTDTGLTGIGEASLEWQERAVEVLLNEWVADRVVGRDPFDIEDVVGGMVRDQYQGGATVMTAISGAEIAMWDLIGKACGQPVYRLIGGRAHETVHAYANGWYGGCRMPAEFAARAAAVVARGYNALKFDPFTTAWKMLDGEEEHAAIEIIDAVARAVGPKVGLMIEIHGRLAAGQAIRFIRRLASHNIVWCEEPVAPENLDLLKDVKAAVQHPISAGERLYTLADFARMITMRACDVVQMDIAHCGGLRQRRRLPLSRRSRTLESRRTAPSGQSRSRPRSTSPTRPPTCACRSLLPNSTSTGAMTSSADGIRSETACSLSLSGQGSAWSSTKR